MLASRLFLFPPATAAPGSDFPERVRDVVPLQKVLAPTSERLLQTVPETSIYYDIFATLSCKTNEKLMHRHFSGLLL